MQRNASLMACVRSRNPRRRSPSTRSRSASPAAKRSASRSISRYEFLPTLSVSKLWVELSGLNPSHSSSDEFSPVLSPNTMFAVQPCGCPAMCTEAVVTVSSFQRHVPWRWFSVSGISTTTTLIAVPLAFEHASFHMHTIPLP